MKACGKNPASYWSSATKEVQDFVASMLDLYFRDREQVQRDEAMRSAGIIIVLIAKPMGFDTCPMDDLDFGAVANLVNLPDDPAMAMFVVVDKATQPANPRPTELYIREIVITDRF